MIVKEKIGEIIQRNRVQKDFSYHDLAVLTGFSRNTLERIEKGSLNPNVEQLFKIFKVLSINVIIDDEKIEI